MSDTVMRIDRLSKKYTLGRAKSGSLRDTITGWFSQNDVKEEEFWALKDLSFEIKRGEALGIIGRNGAGKSTLLKILSRITEPSTGKITIDGRVSSLLEVGTGFHAELTGRENVFLNGTILGMSRAEVKAKFDEIVEFSGVEKFLDTPVKHYSSGMTVRLAFAVAAHLEPEILIVDEVLAVGDIEFQKKCLGKMEDVTGAGRTILFVSHNMGAVKSLCSRGIVLQHGQSMLQGPIDECIDYYMDESSQSIDSNFFTYDDEYFTINKIVVSQEREGSQIKDIINYAKRLQVEIDYSIKQPVRPFRIKLQLRQRDTVIFHIDDTIKNIENEVREKGNYKCTLTIPECFFNLLQYKLYIGADIPGQQVLLDYTPIASFKVDDASGYFKYSSNWPGCIRPSLDISTQVL